MFNFQGRKCIEWEIRTKNGEWKTVKASKKTVVVNFDVGKKIRSLKIFKVFQ